MPSTSSGIVLAAYTHALGTVLLMEYKKTTENY